MRTTYQIEVDGVPIEGYLGVADGESVHYHPVPNIAFPSGLDMVKQLIDVFPDAFPSTGEGDEDEEDSNHGHAAH